jgi:hypothetical protein
MNTLHCDKFWGWFFAVLWRPFWKWRRVEILRCRESIQDIIIYLHMKFRWNRTMLNLWGIVAAILKMATGRNLSILGINLGHHLCTHISNFDDIGQCWIFAVLWRPFWKWRSVEIFQCRESIRGKNFYWSPFSKWPPQYRKNSTLSDIIKIWYVGT